MTLLEQRITTALAVDTTAADHAALISTTEAATNEAGSMETIMNTQPTLDQRIDFRHSARRCHHICRPRCAHRGDRDRRRQSRERVLDRAHAVARPERGASGDRRCDFRGEAITHTAVETAGAL